MENTIIRIKDRHLSDEELNIILNELPYYSTKRIMLELLTITGLRTVELCQLHISNFQNNFTELSYIPAKQGNVKRVYKRYIPSWFAKKLQEYIKYVDLPRVGGYLFMSIGHGTKQNNRGYQPKTFRDWFNKYRKSLYKKGHKFIFDPYEIIIKPDGRQTKLYRCSLHTLRSIWITKMMKSIADNSNNIERDMMNFSKTIHKKFETKWSYFRPMNKHDVLLKATMNVYGNQFSYSNSEGNEKDIIPQE